MRVAICLECGMGMRRHRLAMGRHNLQRLLPVGRAGCSACEQFRPARRPPGTWFDPVVLTTDELIDMLATPIGPPLSLAPPTIVQHDFEDPAAGLELLHEAFWRPERVLCTRFDDPHHDVVVNMYMLTMLVYVLRVMDEQPWLMTYRAWLDYCWNARDNRRPVRFEDNQLMRKQHY